MTYNDTNLYDFMARFHKPPIRNKNISEMKIFEILTNEDENIKNFLRTYNEEKYYHWHKFQRVDKPDAYTYEEFWHAIGLIRATNRIYIILNDTKFSFKIPNFLLEKLHFIDLHL